MKIITVPDPRLRKKSRKIREIDAHTKDVIAKMTRAALDWEQAHEFEISSAMAAPQLGINDRIIIIREDTNDKTNNEFIALINPEIIRQEGKIIKDYEGCLSVPAIYGLVPRHNKIKVKALLENGNEVRIKADGFLARTIQHEIDHLDGILFIDHIQGQTDAFFKLNEKGDLTPLNYEIDVKPQNLFDNA